MVMSISEFLTAPLAGTASYRSDLHSNYSLFCPSLRTHNISKLDLDFTMQRNIVLVSRLQVYSTFAECCSTCNCLSVHNNYTQQMLTEVLWRSQLVTCTRNAISKRCIHIILCQIVFFVLLDLEDYKFIFFKYLKSIRKNVNPYLISHAK